MCAFAPSISPLSTRSSLPRHHHNRIRQRSARTSDGAQPVCFFYLAWQLLMLERALSFKVGVRYPNLIPAPLYVPLPRRLKAPIFAVCLCYCTLLLIFGVGVYVASMFLLIGNTLIALPALMIGALPSAARLRCTMSPPPLLPRPSASSRHLRPNALFVPHGLRVASLCARLSLARYSTSRAVSIAHRYRLQVGICLYRAYPR